MRFNLILIVSFLAVFVGPIIANEKVGYRGVSFGTGIEGTLNGKGLICVTGWQEDTFLILKNGSKGQRLYLKDFRGFQCNINVGGVTKRARIMFHKDKFIEYCITPSEDMRQNMWADNPDYIEPSDVEKKKFLNSKNLMKNGEKGSLSWYAAEKTIEYYIDQFGNQGACFRDKKFVKYDGDYNAKFK